MNDKEKFFLFTAMNKQRQQNNAGTGKKPESGGGCATGIIIGIVIVTIIALFKSCVK